MLIDHQDFLRDLSIDIVAIYILVFLIYYRRHGDREMAITLGLFNLFLFTIVITVTLTEINLAAGFALFAALSIITLRSVNIMRIDVGYLFGAIALALVNGISFPDYGLLALCNLVILLSAFVLDGPWVIRPTVSVDLTLEDIAPELLGNMAELTTRVQDRTGLEVQHLSIQKYNFEKRALRL
ncbi:MAG: DUF4956 domain-containing protein, partial [Paracoccaceae bacterium]